MVLDAGGGPRALGEVRANARSGGARRAEQRHSRALVPVRPRVRTYGAAFRSDLRGSNAGTGTSSGYVLRFSKGQTAFSDKTFAEFFREELGVNIDDPKWSQEGTSKGKRLRYFLRSANAPTAIKTLKALWEHREIFRRRQQIAAYRPVEPAFA
jgi:hypothetical protein